MRSRPTRRLRGRRPSRLPCALPPLFVSRGDDSVWFFRARTENDVTGYIAGMQGHSSTPRSLFPAASNRWRRAGGSVTGTASPSFRLPSSRIDRKSVVQGQRVSVRVDLGGRRILNKNKKNHHV